MTTARPAPVRIDDYANPRFSADVPGDPRSRRADGGRAPARSRADARPGPGRDRVDRGLDDPGFRERLDVLLTGLRDEAGLSPFGVLSDHTVVAGLLRSRLLIQDLLDRHPEILDIPITAPIVIVGLPRTGTSHLHNLISSDPALRSLPYWEALEPVLPPSAATRAGRTRPPLGEHPGRARHDRRRGAAVRADARDDRRQRPRGDPAPGDRLLVDAVRDDGGHADVAGLLPASRPDAALPVPQAGAPGAHLAARWRALGAEVTSALRADPSTAQRVPGRHLRRDASRSGVGHRVGRDDAHVRGTR